MSSDAIKTDFHICENQATDQLWGNHTTVTVSLLEIGTDHIVMKYVTFLITPEIIVTYMICYKCYAGSAKMSFRKSRI